MKAKQVLKTSAKALGGKLSLPLAVLVAILVASSLLTVYVVRKNPSFVGLLKGPEILKKEQEDFVAEVGKSIKLPEGQPTIAEVTDLEKLAGQTFFEKAVEGDKVLIYADAKKVILYRPKEKRVVEVGSINVDTQNGEVAGQTTAAATTVALLNGTETEGVTKEVEARLKEVMPQVEVKLKANAAKNDYGKSLIVVINGEKKAVAASIAQELGMETGSLPEGEKAIAGVDVMIVVGADQVE